jgi:hypothetical protein
VARRHENRQLVESLGQRRLEARRPAELLTEVADLGAAQQHVERSVDTTARPGNQMLDHRLLSRRHLIVGERFEAVAAKLDAARIRALGWSLRHHGSHQCKCTRARDQQSSHGASCERESYCRY